MPAPGPGDLLGGCRIEETIGRGGMGVVYRARQDDLGRDVAIKVIAPERLDDPEARRRFLRELRATAAVEHPNVVPVHEAGLEDDCAYIVMRYVPGTDLRSLVRIEGPLEPERAGEIAARLGEALDAIHDAGYVHRDVKPANVLISRHGHVYLSDLGIAKEALAPDTTTGPDRWVGTVDFAAPEQIRGGPVDGRTDVYALGGVLFFMLTGHVPFERETDEARMWAQLSEPPPVPSSLRARAAGRDRRDRGARAREGPGRAARLDRGARPRRAGGAVGRPDGRGPAAVAPGSAPPPARRRRARRRRGPGRRGGGRSRAARPRRARGAGVDRPAAGRHAGAQRPVGRRVDARDRLPAAQHRRRGRGGLGAQLRGARSRPARPGHAGAGRATAADRQGGDVRRRPRPRPVGRDPAPRAGAPAGRRERTRRGPDHATADAGRRRAGG